MQSKGAIRLVAILLLIACVWQLSFTLVTALQNNKAKKYAEASHSDNPYQHSDLARH